MFNCTEALSVRCILEARGVKVETFHPCFHQQTNEPDSLPSTPPPQNQYLNTTHCTGTTELKLFSNDAGQQKAKDQHSRVGLGSSAAPTGKSSTLNYGSGGLHTLVCMHSTETINFGRNKWRKIVSSCFCRQTTLRYLHVHCF